MDHLKQKNAEVQADRVKEAELDGETFRDMINLDVLTQRILQKEKNGLSDELGKLSIKDTHNPDHIKTIVPEYFEIMDVRKPADLYVEGKLMSVVRDLFKMRQKVE